MKIGDLFNRQETPLSKTGTEPHGIRKYLEGWENRPVIDGNGKVHYKRVYVGTYYSPDEPRKKNVLRKLAYIFFLLVAGAAFAFFASRNIGANRSGYVALGHCVGIIGIGWMLVVAIGYAFSPFEMTEYDYKSGSRALLKSGYLAAVGCGLSSVTYLIYLVLNAGERGTDALLMLGMAVVGLVVWFVRKWEKGLNYLTRESKPSVSPAAFESDEGPARADTTPKESETKEN